MERMLLLAGMSALVLACTCSTGVAAEPVRLVVDAGRPGARISPTMYGVFFEDINYGADGGLYAELVKNRSFEFPKPMTGWREAKPGGSSGTLSILDQDSFNPANPHYLRMNADEAGEGYGVTNEGFAGMGVHGGEEYIFTVQARTARDAKVALRVELVNPGGRVLAQAKVSDIGSAWAKRTATLRPASTEAGARLRLSLESAGWVDMDMVSLFPRNTWKQREKGLRADLVQLLADLKPGFVRFPGGCIVEGRDLSNRYQWKHTIGKVEERRLIINRWNQEFKHRPAPEYFQSFGLGFYEYFLLCEDIGAEPLPIVNCGMACQFNTGELAPLDQLEPYIQDALDLIEFANGPETSPWGRKRAEMGHPKPFALKFLGIGNEQWGPQYIDRYQRFAQALKAKHPEIQLIASAGPQPADDRFRFLWSKLRELNADIIDEHCYAAPAWFFDSARRYDGYDRSGPKVFMGEYAAQSVQTVSPENRNNWHCALSEAAFMTGMERNADVVVMSSYAPLFGHEERWQWRPNMIWLDNLRAYGTPNYYVQQLFGLNRGDRVLPAEVRGQEPATSGLPGLYVSASRDEKAGEIILKVVNSAPEPKAATIELAGMKRIEPRCRAIVLASERLTDENSITDPKKVAPVESMIDGIASEYGHTFSPWSVTVLRVRGEW